MLYLLVDELETDCAPNGALWGRICIKTDEAFFPDAMWNDAVSSVLEMWANALCEFCHDQIAESELYFMDGDYRVLLTKTEDGCAAVSFQANGVEVLKTFSELLPLAENILSCIGSVLTICKNSASSFAGTKQYKRLEKAYRRLKKLIHR